MKIKDIERKHLLIKREAKYRNNSVIWSSSSYRRRRTTNIQTTHNQKISNKDNKTVLSFDGQNIMSTRFKSNTQRQSPSVQNKTSSPLQLACHDFPFHNKQ